MLLFRKHSAVKAFKGTGYFSWLNFKGKVYVAAIIFLLGILLQGVIILLAYGQFKQELTKENQIHEQVTARVKTLTIISPTLLSRCQAGLEAGASIETSDIFEKLDQEIVGLNTLLGKNPKLSSLAKNYQMLSGQLKQSNNLSITLSQYLEIKQVYNKYTDSLIGLEKSFNQSSKNAFLSFLFNSGWLTLTAVLVLIGMIILCWVLLIAAVDSIVIPAELMTSIFNKTNQKVFNVELPITASEGLGSTALILKDSLMHWNSIFLDSKNSICRFDSLCKELVTEIRRTELFAIQLQKVEEALTDNFVNQNQLIAKSHDQLTLLFNNSDELHKIPQRLLIINDDLKNQLIVVQGQIQEILKKTIVYQDESTEIAELAANLSFASEKVNGVVLILDEVAERTELLAFNTAIQAARAGEKGLGFGVVAKEIAKLVDHSKKASEHLSDLLYKIKVKNEQVLKLISENSTLPVEHVSINDEVSMICSNIFETANTSFENIGRLTKVMEIIFLKSNELSKEANIISKLTTEEDESTEDFGVEILDYQLNVKEVNRLAMKVSEISEELRMLAETATSEEEFQ